MNSFTFRELVAFIVFLITLIVISIGIGAGWFTQDNLNAYELPYLLLVVLPLGIYLINDKERIERLNKDL